VGVDPEWRQDFDASVGLDTVELFTFIELTQGDEWGKLVKAHGGEEDRARQRFTQRLAEQIDERGTVDVLRHGVRDQSVDMRLSYRKPAFGVAAELVAHYDANRLTVTRQLPYDPESNKTIDLCLFLNGIPVGKSHGGPFPGQASGLSTILMSGIDTPLRDEAALLGCAGGLDKGDAVMKTHSRRNTGLECRCLSMRQCAKRWRARESPAIARILDVNRGTLTTFVKRHRLEAQ
jgi:hypothetical protein